MTLALATYRYAVDWDDNGNFTGLSDDITAYILSATWDRGARNSEPGSSQAGECTFKLDNSSGFFSTYNAASPIYGLPIPGRRIRIWIRIGSAPEVIEWSGYLDSLLPSPGPVVEVSTAELHGKGIIAKLVDRRIAVEMQTDILTGDAMELALDAGDVLAGDRDIDAGQGTLSRWFAQKGASLLEVLRGLEAAECGRLGESKDGKLTFRDRAFEPAASVVSTYGDGTLALWNPKQEDPTRGIFNRVEAEIRTFGKSEETLLAVISDVANGDGGDPPVVPASGSLVIEITFPDKSTPANFLAVDSWTLIDYQANAAADGEGSDITPSVSATRVDSATKTVITFTNASGSPAYLVLLRAHGIAIIEQAPIQVTTPSTESQDDFGVITFPSPSRWLTAAQELEDYSQHILELYSYPRPRLTFDVKANYNAAHLADVQARDIGDCVRIVAGAPYGLGLDGEFFIRWMQHTVTESRLHTVSMLCEAKVTHEWPASAYPRDETIIDDFGPPDQLAATALATGLRLTFGVEAAKWNASIYECEFRVKLFGLTNKPGWTPTPGKVFAKEADLRLPSEGGSDFDPIANPATDFVFDHLGADSNGCNMEMVVASQAQAFYAARLKNKRGWSAWSDGNNRPRHVKQFVFTEDPDTADDGPPSGWGILRVKAGTKENTVIVRASRPANYSRRILYFIVQIKDKSSGSWRLLNANAGAASTIYDGSAIAHTYNKKLGTLTKESGGAYPALTEGDLILFDVRGGAFDVQHCQWGAVGAVAGDTLTGLFGFRPRAVPTGEEYSDIRIAIVKPIDKWTTEGYLGGEENNGIWFRQYYGSIPPGDTHADIFESQEISYPSTLELGDIEARVWFENGYSRSDDGANHSVGIDRADNGNPSGATGLEVLFPADDPTIPIGSYRIRFNRETENFRTIKTVESRISEESPGYGPYEIERDAFTAKILESGTGATINRMGSYVNLPWAGVGDRPDWNGKVLLIFTDDDSQLDGQVISSNTNALVNLFSPFNKSGTFDWAIVQPWWPPRDTSVFSSIDFNDLSLTLVDADPIPDGYGDTADYTTDYKSCHIVAGAITDRDHQLFYWDEGYADVRHVAYTWDVDWYGCVKLTPVGARLINLTSFRITPYVGSTIAEQSIFIYVGGVLAHTETWTPGADSQVFTVNIVSNSPIEIVWGPNGAETAIDSIEIHTTSISDNIQTDYIPIENIIAPTDTIEKPVWQTPPIPYTLGGEFYVTVSNRNDFGVGTRLIVGPIEFPAFGTGGGAPAGEGISVLDHGAFGDGRELRDIQTTADSDLLDSLDADFTTDDLDKIFYTLEAGGDHIAWRGKVIAILSEQQVQLDSAAAVTNGVGGTDLASTNATDTHEPDVDGTGPIVESASYDFTDNDVNKYVSVLSTPIVDEAQTIPASPYKVTVAHAATYDHDNGVKYSVGGVSLTRTTTTPTTGFYSVDEETGIYTFAAADTTLGVKISYGYDWIETRLKILEVDSDKARLEAPIGRAASLTGGVWTMGAVGVYGHDDQPGFNAAIATTDNQGFCQLVLPATEPGRFYYLPSSNTPDIKMIDCGERSILIRGETPDTTIRWGPEQPGPPTTVFSTWVLFVFQSRVGARRREDGSTVTLRDVKVVGPIDARGRFMRWFYAFSTSRAKRNFLEGFGTILLDNVFADRAGVKLDNAGSNGGVRFTGNGGFQRNVNNWLLQGGDPVFLFGDGVHAIFNNPAIENDSGSYGVYPNYFASVKMIGGYVKTNAIHGIYPHGGLINSVSDTTGFVIGCVASGADLETANGTTNPSQISSDSYYFTSANLGQILIISSTIVLNEAHTIPGSGPYEVPVTHASTFVYNSRVRKASDDSLLTLMTDAEIAARTPPTAGHYSVYQYDGSPGVYVFNAAEAGIGIKIDYGYDWFYATHRITAVSGGVATIGKLWGGKGAEAGRAASLTGGTWTLREPPSFFEFVGTKFEITEAHGVGAGPGGGCCLQPNGYTNSIFADLEMMANAGGSSGIGLCGPMQVTGGLITSLTGKGSAIQGSGEFGDFEGYTASFKGMTTKNAAWIFGNTTLEHKVDIGGCDIGEVYDAPGGDVVLMGFNSTGLTLDIRATKIRGGKNTDRLIEILGARKVTIHSDCELYNKDNSLAIYVLTPRVQEFRSLGPWFEDPHYAYQGSISAFDFGAEIVQIVPASPPYKLTATYSAWYLSNIGVSYDGGAALVQVSPGSESSGHYSVVETGPDRGVYTFHSSDPSAHVRLKYLFDSDILAKAPINIAGFKEAGTDLETENGTEDEPEVHSTAYPFNSRDVWRMLSVLSGTNFTVVKRRILRVRGGNAILDGPIGTVDSLTLGHWELVPDYGIELRKGMDLEPVALQSYANGLFAVPLHLNADAYRITGHPTVAVMAIDPRHYTGPPVTYMDTPLSVCFSEEDGFIGSGGSQYCSNALRLADRFYYFRFDRIRGKFLEVAPPPEVSEAGSEFENVVINEALKLYNAVAHGEDLETINGIVVPAIVSSPSYSFDPDTDVDRALLLIRGPAGWNNPPIRRTIEDVVGGASRDLTCANGTAANPVVHSDTFDFTGMEGALLEINEGGGSGTLLQPDTAADIYTATTIGKAADNYDSLTGTLGVTIISGAGALQTRRVTSHSGGTLTVASAWLTIPSAGSHFVIFQYTDNWLIDVYEVLSVSGGNATLDKPCGTVNSLVRGEWLTHDILSHGGWAVLYVAGSQSAGTPPDLANNVLTGGVWALADLPDSNKRGLVSIDEDGKVGYNSEIQKITVTETAHLNSAFIDEGPHPDAGKRGIAYLTDEGRIGSTSVIAPATTITDEVQTVPASPAYTVVVTEAADYLADTGVKYSGGTPLTKDVVGPPTVVGHYSVDEDPHSAFRGTYYFFSADASAGIKISYTAAIDSTSVKFLAADQLGHIVGADAPLSFPSGELPATGKIRIVVIDHDGGLHGATADLPGAGSFVGLVIDEDGNVLSAVASDFRSIIEVSSSDEMADAITAAIDALRTEIETALGDKADHPHHHGGVTTGAGNTGDDIV